LIAIILSHFTLAQDDLDLLEQQAFQKAVRRVAPSVVRIETIGGVERVGRVLFGSGPTTGLVISPDGYIVSAAFNFLNQPTSILVELPDGTRKAAELVATDHNRMFVLLKIDVDDPLPVPEIVPAEEIQTGAWAIAVGRAFESSEPNVAVGIVSATKRIWSKAIQTDAAVSPNNYGGPLVDIRGRVLGVLVPLAPQAASGVSGVEWYDSGIGFAVPGHELEPLVARLKVGEDLHPGLIGIHFGDESLYTGKPVLAAVRPNSPAADAGLKPGDRIAQVGDRATARAAEVKEELARRYAGDTVRVVALRGDDRIERNIQLVAKLEPYQHPFLGILPMRPRQGDDSQRPAGVAVRYVYPDGPAAEAGVARHDVLETFSGDPIQDADQLRRLLSNRKLADVVELEVRRGKESLNLRVTLGQLSDDVPADALPSANEDQLEEDDKPGAAREATITSVKIPEFENDAWAYIPEHYTDDVPHGLLVWLHPPGDFDRDRLFARWKAHSGRDRLILLAPKSSDAKRWLPREVSLVRKLIDQLTADYTIDASRVVLGGNGAGGTLAYLAAIGNRDVARGVTLVDAAIPRLAPQNEPTHRLAFYVAKTKKSRVADRVDMVIDRLREMKYPVTVRTLGDEPRDLNDDELAELARWIDTLDRI
jgi:serine protease Do